MALAAPVLIISSFHYDVIRYWAGHAKRYRRTDTLPHLIYKEDLACET